MKHFIENLFTPKVARRHLIVLGLSAFTLIWSYVAFALVSGDWAFLSGGSSQGTWQEFWTLTVFLCGFIILLAILGALIYLNATKWMVDWLKKSGRAFVDGLCFWRTVHGMTHPENNVVETVYCSDGGSYTLDDSIPLIIALPLGIILSLLKGTVGTVLCLVVAIGIPVLSPAVVLLGLAGVDALLKLSPVLTGILIILGALAAIFLLIAQPIITFCKKKA